MEVIDESNLVTAQVYQKRLICQADQALVVGHTDDDVERGGARGGAAALPRKPNHPQLCSEPLDRAPPKWKKRTQIAADRPQIAADQDTHLRESASSAPSACQS